MVFDIIRSTIKNRGFDKYLATYLLGHLGNTVCNYRVGERYLSRDLASIVTTGCSAGSVKSHKLYKSSNRSEINTEKVAK
ncbi:31945_t:CDS:2, partial [Gigaspora margarita]